MSRPVLMWKAALAAVFAGVVYHVRRACLHRHARAGRTRVAPI